jgi:hypothetical protein
LLKSTNWGSEIAGVLDLPGKFWPQPGQYLSCQRAERGATGLPSHLFRVAGDPNLLNLAPIPAAWSPGDRLVCTPPQGHGFTLPRSAQRVGLIPFNVSPARLLSLAGMALSQSAAVSLFYEATSTIGWLERVPSQVEILPLAALGKTWIGRIIWPLTWSGLLSPNLGSASTHANCTVMERCWCARTMPCRGLGECGVCAIQTQRGWRLACVDGPVFPLGRSCMWLDEEINPFKQDLVLKSPVLNTSGMLGFVPDLHAQP